MRRTRSNGRVDKSVSVVDATGDDAGGRQQAVQPECGARAASARRGFALMASERQREIASAGGRAAHRLDRAHEFTSEEAREAGRKGGSVVSQDRAHMAAIGRKSGQRCWLKRHKQGADGQD